MDFFYVALLAGLSILLVFYVRVDFQTPFLNLISYLKKQSSTFNSVADFFVTHIQAADYVGVILFAFFSKLFFIPLPAEPYALYAYSQGMNIILLVVLMSGFLSLASVFNYFVGRLFSKWILKKEKNQKMAERFAKWRFLGPLVFSVAILPVPDFAGLIFGAIKIDFKKFAIWTAVGLTSKTIIVLLAFDYIKPYLPELPF